MEVFVSHSFSDEGLAESLVATLAAHDITGYMAERKKEYELLIRDKIRDQISRSSYMVAIITKNSVISPSVYEEIGYAQGKDVPVIVMRDQDAQIGVLTHGLETENFKRESFGDIACKNIVEYLLRMGDRKKPDERTASEAFLKKKRLIWEPEREEYGVNDSVDSLFDWITEGNAIANTYRHWVQFSACPKYLLEDADLHSQDFSNWLQTNRVLAVDGHRYNILPANLREKVGLGLRTFQNTIQNDKLVRYLELHNNGFIQEGLGHRLIINTQELDKPALHLCWTTGAFWTFLAFCKEYFTKLNVKDDIDIFFTVHAAKDLTLFGFGGKIGNSEWAEPYSHWYGRAPPETSLFNVVLRDKISIRTTDLGVAKTVRKTSDKLSNAFGLASSRCYNEDGSFNFGLFSYYDQ